MHDFKVGDLVIEIPARARRHARKPLVGVVTELVGIFILNYVVVDDRWITDRRELITFQQNSGKKNLQTPSSNRR